MSILFFFVAHLSSPQGWAEGMRHDSPILRIPPTGGWLVAATIFAMIGVLFLAWSHNVPESERSDGR